jgi:hypothetical protein
VTNIRLRGACLLDSVWTTFAINIFHKVRGSHFKRAGELVDGLHRCSAKATLEETDVGSVETSSICQLFLAQGESYSSFPDGITQGCVETSHASRTW